MSDQDPYRHWDGYQWLRWNGTAWQPEPPAEQATREVAGPTPQASHPNSDTHAALPRWRQRRWQLGAGVAIAVAVVVGVGFANTGSSPTSSASSPSGTSDAGGLSDRVDVCATEVNVAMDVTLNQTGSVYQAIGTVNPIYSLSESALQYFPALQSQFGSADAETKILSTIHELCAHAGEPILTQGQLQGLTQIATGTDASNLQQVTLYASNPNGI